MASHSEVSDVCFIQCIHFRISPHFGVYNSTKIHFKVHPLLSFGMHSYLWRLVLKYLIFVWVWVLTGYYCSNAEKQSQCPAHQRCPLLWAGVSSGRARQFGTGNSLLFLITYSVCSQPNFPLACFLCQNPLTTISNCQNAPYLSMPASNPNQSSESFITSSSRSSNIP